MLLLLETAAGFGLFKLQKNKILEGDVDAIYDSFATPEKAQKAVTLEAFQRFKDTESAMDAATELIEGGLGKTMKKFLKKNIVNAGIQDELGVMDKALGGVIKKELSIDAVYNPGTNEIIRGIRAQLEHLVEGLDGRETQTMALGLAHTLSRFKLKFSPDKVDTMIVQAVGLLDDLDKELNNFAMRLREWYGWHFPELAKVVSDNLVFARVIKKVGMRQNIKHTDFEDVLPEEIAEEVKKSAEVSMGTDITDEDLNNIQELADRVIELSEYRASLAEYLRNRMMTIAPNLTHMVGELVGARLISHAGSLMNLAKQPASTVQILGAEKALFRALKTKKATPKYGLIYHASLVGQSAPKNKGKISRVLAAKLALCSRVDALADNAEGPQLAESTKDYVERRLMTIEGQGEGRPLFAKKTEKVAKRKADTATGTAEYNAAADNVDPEEEQPKKKKKKTAEAEEAPVEKKKKKKKTAEEEE